MFIKPWPSGPSSVHSRSAPRGSVTRRQAPWQARSHAGAAQNPCAAAVCASLLLLYPIEPGGGAPGFTCLAQGPLTNCPGDPLARIRPSLDDHVPAGPRAEQLIPTRPNAGRGDPGRHVPLNTSPPGHEPRRHVPLTTPRGPRGPRVKHPPSLPGRRDRRGHVTLITSGPP